MTNARTVKCEKADGSCGGCHHSKDHTWSHWCEAGCSSENDATCIDIAGSKPKLDNNCEALLNKLVAFCMEKEKEWGSKTIMEDSYENGQYHAFGKVREWAKERLQQ